MNRLSRSTTQPLRQGFCQAGTEVEVGHFHRGPRVSPRQQRQPRRRVHRAVQGGVELGDKDLQRGAGHGRDEMPPHARAIACAKARMHVQPWRAFKQGHVARQAQDLHRLVDGDFLVHVGLRVEKPQHRFRKRTNTGADAPGRDVLLGDVAFQMRDDVVTGGKREEVRVNGVALDGIGAHEAVGIDKHT